MATVNRRELSEAVVPGLSEAGVLGACRRRRQLRLPELSRGVRQ